MTPAAWARSNVVETQARVGDIAGAKAMVATIADAFHRALTLREIAAAQVWADGIASAEERANAFTDPKERCYACIGVAEPAGALAPGCAKPEVEADDDP